MYPYLNDISVYDLIGVIDIIIIILNSVFITKNSGLFPGNTAKFLISYSKKSPVDNFFMRSLSSERFWLRLEKITIIFSWLLCFLFSKSFSVNILQIGNDYYGVVTLTFLIMLWSTYIFRLNTYSFFDLITPYLALHSSVLKIACFFHGCCRGFETSYGFYNQRCDAYEFPVQIVESFLSLLLFFLLLYFQKRKIFSNGLMYPVFLILYSFNRLIAGFFRIDDKLFLFFTDYQIISICFMIFGTILLILLTKYNNQIKKVLSREPFPGYMKYKRSLYHENKIHNKKK